MIRYYSTSKHNSMNTFMGTNENFSGNGALVIGITLGNTNRVKNVALPKESRNVNYERQATLKPRWF